MLLVVLHISSSIRLKQVFQRRHSFHTTLREWLDQDERMHRLSNDTDSLYNATVVSDKVPEAFSHSGGESSPSMLLAMMPLSVAHASSDNMTLSSDFNNASDIEQVNNITTDNLYKNSSAKEHQATSSQRSQERALVGWLFVVVTVALAVTMLMLNVLFSRCKGAQDTDVRKVLHRNDGLLHVRLPAPLRLQKGHTSAKTTYTRKQDLPESEAKADAPTGINACQGEAADKLRDWGSAVAASCKQESITPSVQAVEEPASSPSDGRVLTV